MAYSQTFAGLLFKVDSSVDHRSTVGVFFATVVCQWQTNYAVIMNQVLVVYNNYCPYELLLSNSYDG